MLKNVLIILIQILTLLICPWVGLCNVICMHYARAHGKTTGECLSIAYLVSGLMCWIFYSSGWLYWSISLILTIVVCCVCACRTDAETPETQSNPVSDDVTVQEEDSPVLHYYGDIHIDKAVFLRDHDFNNR
jgi:multisubunit Na+/H+ antiporter MnhG subunit